MSISLLVWASALAAPVPNLEAIRSTYPSEYLQKEKSAAAFVLIVVAPDGKVAQCQELSTFGDEKFARELCRLQGRVSWRAAKGADGKRTYGVVRTFLKLFIPGSAQGDEIARVSVNPNLEFAVNRLPASAPGFLDVRVTIDVDSAGNTTACEPKLKDGVPAGYGKAACDAVRKISIGQVALNGAFLPRYIMDTDVRFVAERAKDSPSPQP